MIRRFFPTPGIDAPAGFDALPGLDASMTSAELMAAFSFGIRELLFDDPEVVELRSAASEFGPLVSSTGRPIDLYIPEHYEPGYPYPLIVWLHGRGRSERELGQLMPRISERNCLGLSFRGPAPSRTTPPSGFGWPESASVAEQFAEELHDTVCRLRRAYHVHSERIYLAGFDEGAGMCLRLLLNRPEWFAGAIAFGGSFPEEPHALTRYRDLSGKRVLVGTGSRSTEAPVGDAIRTGRLLHAAGLAVTTRTYDAAHEVNGEMLSHVNHWIMEDVCAPV